MVGEWGIFVPTAAGAIGAGEGAGEAKGEPINPNTYGY
jgi:hypothetical protein